MLCAALKAAAIDESSKESAKSNDARTLRILDRINRELLTATFFHGLIARSVALTTGSGGKISACIADYQETASGESNKGSKGVSGPLGNVLLLYQPAFRRLRISQGHMVYDNSTGIDADGKHFPIKLFSLEPAKAVCLGDFVLVASTAPVVNGKATVGDWDPYRLIIKVNGRTYNVPLGPAFMGPFDVDSVDRLRPRESELYDFKAFKSEPIRFGPEFVPPVSSEAAKPLLSSIAMIAESCELQFENTLPLSEQSANPSIAVQMLVIIDLRALEDKYGRLTWSHYQGSMITVQFEKGALDIRVETTPVPLKSLGPCAPEWSVEYPFAILKGNRINLRLAGILAQGEPLVSELEIHDCVGPRK